MNRSRPFEPVGKAAFVVPSVRETDAIGGALRAAFASRIDLPEDMANMLDRLEANPQTA